jgi:hypothetical protein
VGLKRSKGIQHRGYSERTELVRSLKNISESGEQGNSACSLHQSQPLCVCVCVRAYVIHTASMPIKLKARYCGHIIQQSARNDEFAPTLCSELKYCACRKQCFFYDSVWSSWRASLRVPNSENLTFASLWRSSTLQYPLKSSYPCNRPRTPVRVVRY